MTHQRYIRALAWDETLQDYVEIPLDDAAPNIIRLARLVNGRQMDDHVFKQLIKQHYVVEKEATSE